MRLAALLLASALLAPLAAADRPVRRPADEGRWRFDSYPDKVTGHEITMLLLAAESGGEELMLACEEQELLLLADFAQRLSTEDLDVKERLGRQGTAERRWEIAEDSYEILVHPARGAELLQHLAEMEEARTLELTVTPDGKRPVRATFRMAGLARKLPKLEGCYRR